MDMNTSVKKRREALGLSQTAVAQRVTELAGTDFSQQSLARFENKPGAQSTFLYYILRALDEAEGIVPRSNDPASISEPAPPPYADIVDKLRVAHSQGKFSTKLRSAILDMIDAAAPGIEQISAQLPSVKNAPSIEQAELTVDLHTNASQQREFTTKKIEKMRKDKKLPTAPAATKQQ